MWLDETASQLDLIDSGIPEDELYKSTFISPAAAKKLAKVKKIKVDWDLHIGKIPGGLTIVSENDPRPAIKVEPGAEFAVDDDETQD